MKNTALFALLTTGMVCATTGFAATSALNTSTAIRPVSQYGLIQNVQDYSTNPFWNKNSIYNQAFPQPVYVTGPELTTSDCTSTIGGLISSYCASNNDCIGMQLSDVRPVIMLQLSRMPGHNYATQCSGYIDSEFNSYTKKHATAVPNGTVAFPGATDANPNYNASEFKLENPYEIKPATWQGDDWMMDRINRIKELQELQSQNGVGNEHIAKSDFPTTISDLSFAERMELKQQGYEPYKDSSAYHPIEIESEEAYFQRRSTFCQQRYGTTIATLDADLQTLMRCRENKTPLSKCKTQGKY